MKRPAQWIAALATAMCGLFPARHLLAQGCSMCYSDAAAQSGAGIRALQHGIVVLLVPSLALFIAVFAVAYRRRNVFNEASRTGEPALQPLSQANSGPVINIRD